MNAEFTYTVTIKDVYGTFSPALPKGYEAVEFRHTKPGEIYLSIFSPPDFFHVKELPGPTGPRIILRACGSSQLRRFIFEETGISRPIEENEYYLDVDGDIMQWRHPSATLFYYPVLHHHVDMFAGPWPQGPGPEYLGH
jgi:hypothetical protein